MYPGKITITTAIYSKAMTQHIFELTLVSVSLLMGVASGALPDCNNSCGNFTDIPFPFGIGTGCFLDKWYEIECRPQKENGLVPFLKKLDAEVLSITIYMPTIYPMSSFIKVKLPTIWNRTNSEADAVNLQGSPFYYSYEFNSFIAVGCNTTSMLESRETGRFQGCMSKCHGDEGDTDTDFTTKGSRSRYSNCSSGIDCCLTGIPYAVQDFLVRFLDERKEDTSFGSYAFMFNGSGFDSHHLDLDAIRKLDKIPVVLEWGVVKDLSITNYSNTFPLNFSCSPTWFDPSKQSQTVNCICATGYEGNPYAENGCRDIDECKTGQHNCHSGTCVNRPGYYDCVVNRKMLFVVIGLGAGLGFLVSILFLWWVYKITKKRKERKLKDKYFQRNGGLLLQQQSHSINYNVEKSKLFSSRELEIATDHFNVNRILGQGGGGTVYKGILPNGEIVAVKKSKVIDMEQVEQFVNEIMILSQLNHRNIVKLLGCCLETEIPLLVYEFISYGALHDHVHTPDEENPMSWDMRLQIAIDVANALSYMHSATLVPIYHRDIKSSNILLDGRYRAKIADFGISRLVSLEQTHLTTLVQGTFGYFDPEYFQSSQYTDKSDVYSFGIVLVELLTRQKPISSLREREGRSLATYFVHSIEDNLFSEITDPYILNQVGIEEIYKVGNLAYRCLDLNGSKRPTMKEVKLELEAIKMLENLSVDGIEKFVGETMESFDVNSPPPIFRADVDRFSDAALLNMSHTW